MTIRISELPSSISVDDIRKLLEDAGHPDISTIELFARVSLKNTDDEIKAAEAINDTILIPGTRPIRAGVEQQGNSPPDP